MPPGFYIGEMLLILNTGSMKKENKIIADTLALTLIVITATVPVVAPDSLNFQVGAEKQVILAHEPLFQKPCFNSYLFTKMPVKNARLDILKKTRAILHCL